MVEAAPLSDDARVIALLCSSVAAARGEVSKPLGPAAWAKVAARLAERGESAGMLLGLAGSGSASASAASSSAVGALLVGLDLDLDFVVRQLGRSAQLAFELDRLASRGIALRTLADEAYPARLRDRLGSKAPPVLFTAGEASILSAGGVAIVGSRDVDDAGAAFAEAIAAEAARSGRVVVSGAARGVDQVAMVAALQNGGLVAGVLPEGLERRLRESGTRAAIAEGQLSLASPYHPVAPFSAGAAMGRNRLIYALSDAAVVVASATEASGTWAGAVEAIEARWVPVFVRTEPGSPQGNLDLVALGGRPLDAPLLPDLSLEVELEAGAPHEPSTERPSPSTRKAPQGAPAAEQAPGFEQGTLDL
jgi:predicted Rossmann fold nucleotide-binding protein DprA/Smf involved in DNA uptake